MEVKATVRYLGIAPRKVRLLAAVVKGMDVARAEHELMRRDRRAAPVLLKLLRSAAANARHNFHAESHGLKIKDVRIDAGPVATRYRARAFGRAASITRRTSHVSLVLETALETGAGASRSRASTAAPIVREATVEDLRGGAGGAPRSAAAEKKQQKKKTSGFMPRLFQRKVI